MELIGEKVTNPKYGEGNIVDFDGEIVDISFNDCKRKFSLLKSIELNSIVFDNEDVQKEVKILVLKEKQKIDQIYSSKFSFSPDYSENTVLRNYSREEEIIKKLRNKVIKNQSIAFDLIELYDDKNFEDCIFNKCFSTMKTIICKGKEKQYTEKGRALVIVALTYLALKYYNAGNLESYIFDLYMKYNYPIKIESAFENKEIVAKAFWKAIRNKASSFDYRKVTMYKDQTSYVAVPLVLSVVPHCRVRDLFDFAKDIYKKKLLFTEDISEDLLYEKINETLDDLKLKNLITDKYDDNKIGDYLLCTYTKCCIQTGKCQDDLVLIIGECIKIISNYLTLPENAYIVPSFYKDGFDQWSSSFNEKAIFEENVVLTKPSFYLYSGRDVYIKTGRICMDVRFDPNTVQLVVFSNEKEVDRMPIKGTNDIEYDYKDDIVGGYIINRIDYKLDISPINNISYSIVANGQIVYSSKNYLFRNNIFFDERGYEVKPGNKYVGEIKVVTKEEQLNNDYDLTKLYSFGDYFIYSAVIDDTMSYEFDNNSYIFYRIEKPEILGYSVPWASVESNNKEYKIYKSHSFIFRDSTPISGLYYVLDGKKYDFIDNDDNHSISIYAKEHNDYNTYIIRVKSLIAGFHSLTIYKYDNDEKIKNGSFDFISDCKFNREVDVKEKGCIFKYKSNFLKTETEIFYENGCENKSLNIFVPNLGYSKLILFPSDFSYSIDGESWFNRDNKIMLCSIPNSIPKILVCGPNQSSAYFLDANGEKQYITLSNKEESKYVYCLYLSHLRDLMNNGIKEKRVYFEVGNRSKYVLFKFVPDVFREDCVFSYDTYTGTHSFKIVFEGCNYVWVKIYALNNSEKVYISKKIKSGDILTIQEKDIDDTVTSLNILLYMIKTHSLEQKPFDKPFFTFEKYKIPNRIVTFDYPDNQCDIWFENNNKYLCFKTCFSGPKTVNLLVVPTGKNFEKAVILDENISSGEIIKIDVSLLIFNSYFVRLLNTGDTVDSTWLFHKIIHNEINPYIGKTFSLLEFKSPSKTLYPKNITVKTKYIKCVYDSICLLSADIYKDKVQDNVEYLLDVVDINEETITFKICGEINCFGTGIPKSKSGKEILIVRR